MVIKTTTAAVQEMLGAVPKGLSHPVEYVRVRYLSLFMTCWEVLDCAWWFGIYFIKESTVEDTGVEQHHYENLKSCQYGHHVYDALQSGSKSEKFRWSADSIFR
jgi:hypothetical protein